MKVRSSRGLDSEIDDGENDEITSGMCPGSGGF